MKKNIKYILGILLSSVLVVTGCGSSSSNNPVGNGTVSSGLVSVNGNVKNSNGNGTVSFYTPTAIYGTNLDANNLRTSIANNEVYTFNIDENGNYAGQIPAGEYYVIAQNSDGSMKYASARQSFVSSARAEVTNEQTVDIVLVPTITISGMLDLESYSTPTTAPIVYIENMPFADLNTKLNTSNGSYLFSLNSIPLSEESYTLCSDIWYSNMRYHFTYKITSEQIDSAKSTKEIKEITIHNVEVISLSGKNVKIKFKDEDNNDVTHPAHIIAITEDHGIYRAIGTSNKIDGYCDVLPINKNTDVKMLVIQTDDSTDDTTIINREDLDCKTDGFIIVRNFGKS